MLNITHSCSYKNDSLFLSPFSLSCSLPLSFLVFEKCILNLHDSNGYPVKTKKVASLVIILPIHDKFLNNHIRAKLE